MLSLSKHVLIAAAIAGGPLTNYAATPQLAAQQVVGAPNMRAIRTNIVGRYAVVETRGGSIEDGPPPKLTLLEHFAFGWQAVDFVQDQCAIAPRGIGARTRAALLNGMPALATNDRGCASSSYPADRGGVADIAAIRHSEDRLLIPNVTVAGSFAISEWFGGGGGQHLYRKSAQGWRIVSGIGGGGELDASQLIGKGVPLRDACALPVHHDSTCPK